MIVSFDRLPEQLVSGFKGGDGVVSVRAYDDDMGRILQLTVPVGGIHVEPMGLYGGKQTTLDAISGK